MTDTQTSGPKSCPRPNFATLVFVATPAPKIGSSDAISRIMSGLTPMLQLAVNGSRRQGRVNFALASWGPRRDAQFPTDCTALNGTVSAPICNCMPLLRLCTPVAVPVTVNGSAVVVPSALPATTATL